MASVKTTKALKKFRIKNFTCQCLISMIGFTSQVGFKTTKALKNFRIKNFTLQLRCSLINVYWIDFLGWVQDDLNEDDQGP